MIKYNSFQSLGKANHGWLQANHHFSFGQYYNPNRMGFGSIRVINDDKIEPKTGFPTHPHANMEIITFVRSGEVSHQDSVGNQGVTKAGEVQVMSAGTGIQHSEYNQTNEPLTLFQIWIEPNINNVTPRWETKPFPTQFNKRGLPLLVSGYEEDKGQALFIYQDTRIYGGKISKGYQLTQSLSHQAYVLVSKGQVELINQTQNIEMNQGDGAEVTEQTSLTILAKTDAEVLILDVPN
ncbi:pirin family protein [Paraglaciecola sp.]|uniref:pirin family protein n=1 Tax=Paraglaciecola sp. TaxID=1920173 RepID=UPI003EF7E779